MKAKSLGSVLLLATPWTAAYQAPPPMGFSRQEYWSGVPLPSLKEGIDMAIKHMKICSISRVLQFSRSVVSDSLQPHGLQHASFPVHHQLPESTQTMSIESVMPSNHLILCHPLLLLLSIFPNIRVFSNESALHIRWPKYWSFSFNISPSNEHPGLISFSMD